MTVNQDGAACVLTAELPEGSFAAMVGLLVAPRSILFSYEVTEFSHNEYNAISLDGSDGVALGHVACSQDADSNGKVDPLKLWPGRVPGEKLGCKQGLAPWPIKGGRTITITLNRMYGATDVTRAYLIVVPMTANVYDQRLCDGRTILEDLPHWKAVRWGALVAGGGYEEGPKDVLWNARDSYTLRVRQFMALGYSNNGGYALAEDYRSAFAVRFAGNGDEAIFESYGDEFVHLPEASAYLLSDFCCNRDPQILIPDRTSVKIYGERETTTYAKVVAGCLYGTLLAA